MFFNPLNLFESNCIFFEVAKSCTLYIVSFKTSTGFNFSLVSLLIITVSFGLFFVKLSGFHLGRLSLDRPLNPAF